MRVPYTRAQVRKAIVALVAAVVAVLAHFDVVVGDEAGDVILLIDLAVLPLLVFKTPNDS